MSAINAPPKEGDIYKVIKIDEHTFELRFGFYADFERESGEPVVIYPDLVNNRYYTSDGKRIVTAIQDPCNRYRVSSHTPRDECCNDCDHYKTSGDDIGLCTHPANGRQAQTGEPIPTEPLQPFSVPPLRPIDTL